MVKRRRQIQNVMQLREFSDSDATWSEDSMPGRVRAHRGTYITVSVLGVLIPVVILAYYAVGEGTKAKSTVLLVSVLFRHGARSPTETYPLDPYQGDTWPDGWGSLTKVGKLQLHRLGSYLRQRYADLLPELYSSSDMFMMSSDHDRCLMSAQLCLAGLYPPSGRQVWKEDLAWQPIPVHTTPRRLDQLIVVKKPCPAYDRALAQTLQSDEIKTINSANKELYEYLSKHSGAKVDSILDVEMLYNTLEIEENNNLELPEWTKDVYPKKMEDLAAKSLSIFTQTTTMKRLKGGPIVAEMIQNMADKLRSLLKPDRKLFLYSGHDLTIVSVMRALGFNKLLKPDNGAAVIMELHKPLDGSDHVVELHYLNNSLEMNTEELEIPQCGKPCLLKTLISVTEAVRPVDWDKECSA